MRRKPNHKMNNGGNNRRRYRGGDNNAGKIKSASANRDKYLNLARDAMASGDRVEAENFLQHAEHYYRVLSFLQEEDARNRPARDENSARDDNNDDGQSDDNRTRGNGNQASEDNSDDDTLAMAS